jgi:hypothetical protein
MKTDPPNTIILEVDPLPGEDGQDQARPMVCRVRGFLVGTLLCAAIAADRFGYGWNAFHF